MDVLRCRTPEIVRKEVWMYVLAYNLIPTVMVRAALSKGVCPRQLSFKGALQAVNGFTPALILAEGAVVGALLDALLESVAAYNSARSEEHTSELQSRPHLVCRLLLAKKTTTAPVSLRPTATW